MKRRQNCWVRFVERTQVIGNLANLILGLSAALRQRGKQR